MNDFVPLGFVREHALRIGFHDCGAAKAEPMDCSVLTDWLSKGYNADMQYMQRNFQARKDIRELFPEARTVFSFLISYNGNDTGIDTCGIASYALGEDYHKVIKRKLYTLMECIKEVYPFFQGRAFVDSAPVLERAWAERAGLGWIGKSGCLVSAKFGSKVFLSEIVSDCQSEYSQSVKNRCAGCHRCVDDCPTGAIKQGGLVDCNLCISYQTIENKGEISAEFNTHQMVYGCDICLNACPWNAVLENPFPKAFSPMPETLDLIGQIRNRNVEKSLFNKVRKHSAMERIKYGKFLSNINHASDSENRKW